VIRRESRFEERSDPDAWNPSASPPTGPDALPAGAGAKLLTTVIAWIIVYLLLMALFGIFEDRLAELELWLRLLIVSAVIVAVMANLVMPLVLRIVGRLVGGGGTR
jgi:antibiotic biosynthesis monooxygenase (ABM) superfamily enzyme